MILKVQVKLSWSLSLISLPFFAVAEERNDGGLRSDTRPDALHRVAGRLTGEARTLINSIKFLISFHMMIIIRNYLQHEHLCPQATLVRNGEAVKIIEPHKPNRPVSSQNIVSGFARLDSVS